MPGESSVADTYEEGGGWNTFGARNGDDEAESGVRASWQSAAESTEVGLQGLGFRVYTVPRVLD